MFRDAWWVLALDSCLNDSRKFSQTPSKHNSGSLYSLFKDKILHSLRIFNFYNSNLVLNKCLQNPSCLMLCSQWSPVHLLIRMQHKNVYLNAFLHYEWTSFSSDIDQCLTCCMLFYVEDFSQTIFLGSDSWLCYYKRLQTTLTQRAGHALKSLLGSMIRLVNSDSPLPHLTTKIMNNLRGKTHVH
jgi:hypothetical protein